MYYMDKAELLSVRLEKPLLVVMAKDMKDFHYPTKSDFLREALREKHLKLEEERRKDKAIETLRKLKGSVKLNISEEEYRRNREDVGERLIAEYAKKFGINQTKPLQAISP
jgi:Arc/MetJ-type ribon-helix-helix transcriptional regulator